MHDHSHAHSHAGQGGRQRGAERRGLMLALVTTTVILVAEAVGGWLSNSLALLADAGHMLSDALALVLAYAAISLAARPATRSKTYGWHRLEILAALLNGVVLVLISVFIVWKAYKSAAEREAGVFEQLALPLAKSGGASSQRSAELLGQLVGLGEDMRHALLRRALRSAHLPG